jgi:CBS domain-containing protein
MSLMVTFNGQFKPYQIPAKKNDNVHRIREMAPTFNDLIHHYLDEDTAESHARHIKQNQNKSKISSYVEGQKSHKRKVYARDVMSTKIHSLLSSQTIGDGMELLSKYKIHHIPIVDNNVLVGIVSDRLLLNILGTKKPTSTKLEEIMVRKVLIGQEHSSISDIARVMLEEHVSCIPIATKNLELKGLVTNRDILELLVHSFPLEIYA